MISGIIIVVIVVVIIVVIMIVIVRSGTLVQKLVRNINIRGLPKIRSNILGSSL